MHMHMHTDIHSFSDSKTTVSKCLHQYCLQRQQEMHKIQGFVFFLLKLLVQLFSYESKPKMQLMWDVFAPYNILCHTQLQKVASLKLKRKFSYEWEKKNLFFDYLGAFLDY